MIGAIEAAMINRIREVSDAGLLGYRLKLVEGYGGQFEDDLLREVVNGLPGAFPVYTGGKVARTVCNHREWMMGATFGVLVAAINKRNEGARRTGATPGEVGTYQMAEDIASVLMGQSFGLAITPLMPVGIKPFPLTRGDGQAVSIVAVEFETDYTVTARPDILGAPIPITVPRPSLDEAFGSAARLADFMTAHVDWDVAPHDPPDSVPLPEGSAGGGTDHLTIEEA